LGYIENISNIFIFFCFGKYYKPFFSTHFLAARSTNRLSIKHEKITAIVNAIKEDKVEYLKELLTGITSLAKMIDQPLDQCGNNLWTLAAERGTEEIMNYLLDIISPWSRKYLYHVLHFWTRHRERSCMDIVEKAKEIIQVDQSLIDYLHFNFQNLEAHLNEENPDPLRDHLKKLKQYLDTTIAHLGICWIPWPFCSPKRQLKTVLLNLRKELLWNDREWHHNSLTGIILQTYPPDSMIVQRIIELEIECHNPKAGLNEKHNEDGGEEGLELKSLNCETGLFCNRIKYERFESCIYERVGKSPCTLKALKMNSQTCCKCNFFSSFFSLLMKACPLLACLSLFIFSFSLIAFDISTDVKLVWEFFQANIHLDMNPTSDYVNLMHRSLGQGGFYEHKNDITKKVLCLTSLAVILPVAHYFVAWLRDNEMGFGTLKAAVC
jgi:hypothetical protein